MGRGRPATPLGTHGVVNVVVLGEKKVRATTYLRLYTGETVEVQATAPSATKAKNQLEERCKLRLQGDNTNEITNTSKLSALLADWIDQHEVTPKSKGTYQRCIDVHINARIGQLRLNELTTQRLQNFLSSLTPGTAKTARAVLGNALGHAVRMGAITHNPMRDTKLPKRVKKDINALTDEQMDAYRANIEKWIKSAKKGYSRGEGVLEVIDLLRGSGLRIGEALALRWEDVDLDKGLVTVLGTTDDKGGRQCFPKTDSSRRTIPVAPVAVKALQRQFSKPYRDQFEMVFPSERGTYRTVVNVERQLRDGRGDSKIKPHDFRKTVATRIEAKYGILAASRYLGHSSTSVTENSYLAVPEVLPDYTSAFD